MMDSIDRISAWTRPALSELRRVRTADLKRLHSETWGRYRAAVCAELMRRLEVGDEFGVRGHVSRYTVTRKGRSVLDGMCRDGLCTATIKGVHADEIAWAE